jgi:NADH:ubiquinone reductase (H+-translocating)
MRLSKLQKYRLPLALAGATAVVVLAARFAAAAKRTRHKGGGKRRRVVVVGAGFGGLAAARRLVDVPRVDLTVIDQNNHHLFQPLLYQVATAALSPDDIACPIRDTLVRGGRATVRMQRVTGVDTNAREVVCGEERIPYDVLVLATGSEPSYFGHSAWRKLAPGLKTLEDALGLRRQILGAFEQAALASDPAERDRLRTFVLVGGGPTGVEMAGAIAELAHDMLPRDYPGLEGSGRVVVVEAETELLAHFAPGLSRYSEQQLRRMGVELRTGVKVSGMEPGRLKLGDEELVAGVIIWAAGVEATPVAKWLGVKPGHGGQVQVGPDLKLPDHPDVYVIGDAALALGGDGKKLPGLAAVAKQQGHYVAERIVEELDGPAAAKPFRYRDYGSLATIGRNRAVAEIGGLHLTGLPAWLVWAGADIVFLIGFRNRALVSAQWLISYVTHRRDSRIIS